MTEATPAPRLAPLSPAAQLLASALPERLARLVVGLWLYGVSIALMIEGAVGASPWDVFHTGAQGHAPFSLGVVMIAASALVLLAWIPLRQRPGLGTLLNATLLGPFADVALALLPTPSPLIGRVGYMLGGVATCAFATALYIGARLGPGPRDGLMTGLARRTGSSIRMVRTALEVSVLAVGVALGGSVGVGTVVFALGVGPLTQFFLPRLAVRLGTPDAPAAPGRRDPITPIIQEHS